MKATCSLTCHFMNWNFVERVDWLLWMGTVMALNFISACLSDSRAGYKLPSGLKSKRQFAVDQFITNFISTPFLF